MDGAEMDACFEGWRCEVAVREMLNNASPKSVAAVAVAREAARNEFDAT